MPESQEEWTKVRRKTRRNAGSNPRHKTPQPQPQSQSQPPAPGPGPGPGPDFTAARLTVSDIRRDHERYMAHWQESACRRRLVDLLTASAQPPRVTRAVCLGIGSFDPEDGAWEVKRRAHIQLAAFLSIIYSLQKHQQGHHKIQIQDREQQDEEQRDPPPIRCLFQEPLFTSSDKEFIRGLGHEVVESPQGFAAVDGETLVFGVHLYRDVYSRAIAECVPAVFVGTGLDVWKE